MTVDELIEELQTNYNGNTTVVFRNLEFPDQVIEVVKTELLTNN